MEETAKEKVRLKFNLALFCLILTFAVARFIYVATHLPLSSPKAPPVNRSLEKYAFFNLQKRSYSPSPITFTQTVKISPKFTTKTFSYFSDGRKITGLANIPDTGPDLKLPVLILVRGYVQPKDYQPGIGTQTAASYFAQNGFLTLAPDFIGFGGSDPAFPDSLETRFDAPVEVLNLLSSVSTIPQADQNRVGFWGHSNGGQITLSVLEISQKPYPTVLWAPVSKGFPYSMLHFASEMPDGGAFLNSLSETFLRQYDPQHFSIVDYFPYLNAPLQVHQGEKDKEVPQQWSDTLTSSLRRLGKKVDYYIYPGEDHNFNQGSSSLALSRNLNFFRSHLF